MKGKGSYVRSAVRGLLFALPILTFCLSGVRAAEPSAALSAAGWEESTPGRWNRLPERKVEAAGNRLSGEFVLVPGSGVSWEKKVSWDNATRGDLAIEFLATGTNPSSRDYREFDTRFPLSVTVVFGKDSQELGWRTRFLDFFRKVWSGFPPRGIRLVYAWGNQVPVNSMYRTADEETVFTLAGEDEKGKAIQSSRDIRKDFMAAYGRYPKGPATRIIVSAVRPSKEKGEIRGRVTVILPVP